jgi:hypothetical protein
VLDQRSVAVPVWDFLPSVRGTRVECTSAAVAMAQNQVDGGNCEGPENRTHFDAEFLILLQSRDTNRQNTDRSEQLLDS